MSVVDFIRSPAATIADLLEHAMSGMGTKDTMLIYLVAKFFHHFQPPMVDLRNEIKQAYQSKYGKPLAKRVEGETSGDYRKLLLALLNKQY